MKIAFNPSTVAALTTPPDNKDITFDLRGQNIFARGVKFYGTDTNTWRDIKINNVSIGSNVLDLRNGSNTTLTNTDGVVTINSTWRPVVDNLTSNSTTSSLSANQGRILAGLINGKSDSDHNHDNRYVKKSGDTMLGVLTIATPNFGALTIQRNDDANGAFIQFRGKSSVYGYIGLNNSAKDKQFLRWNSDTSKNYTILDTSSTYISNGKGVINGTTITQVDNATNSTNARKLVNWYSARPTSLNAQFGDGSLRIFYATSSTTEGKPDEDSHILHLAWDTTGGYDAQLAVHAKSGKVSTRAQNVGTWHPWKTLAFITDIPTSLKNPYSFNVFGVVYDGSAAKTVTTSTFISQLGESGSVVTDGTMFVTSWASDKGFADPNSVNIPYKRKAVHLWEYIKAKTDSLYATKSHNHDDRYYTKAESNAKYITDITTSVNKLTFTRNGANIARNITVNVVYSQGWLPNIPNEDATTKASPGLLIYNSYEQAIGTNAYSSVLSINTGGTIQIAGNWGDDHARNLYWRSQSDRNVADYPWKSWRTILDSENYSFTLDSRYYTESEVNSLLDAKLNRQNLSYGGWNPRGWNLAADYCYNGGDLSISENSGQIHVSIDGYFWQNEGQYRVLDTSDISDIRGGLTLHQYLSATDANWYPLVWGEYAHANTSDSTGGVYKSYDKLSWQTSSQTLYATNIQTNNIKGLTVGGGIYWNPYVEATTNNTDAASITLVRSGVAGGTTLVLSQQNDTNDTIQFQTNPAARLYHNSYPILTTQNTYVNNNKGYINGAEITQVNNSDTVGGLPPTSFAPHNGVKFGHSPDANIWHRILQFTTSWVGQVTFMYSPEECQRNYWGIFNINIRSKDIWFRGFSFANLPQIKCCGDDNNNWSVWIKGSANSYDPYGVIQILNFSNASIVSVGISKSQTTEPSGTYNKAPDLFQAGSVNWSDITNKLVAENEFNIVNSGFNNDMYFNYLPINDRHSTGTATISNYIFGNGHKGQASLKASGFIKNESSDSYVLLGGGGHKTLSDFSLTSHTHTVFKNNLMIKGTNGISDSASIHLGIGDSDTGFKWISDGVCQMYANYVAIGQWTQEGMNWFTNPTVNGQKIWHAGNDGSGSGLDSDLIDGLHASRFPIYYNLDMSTTSNYWYKLGTARISESDNIMIHIYGGDGWNSNSYQNAFATLMIKTGHNPNENLTREFGATMVNHHHSEMTYKLISPSNDTVDIWVKMPWSYSNGWYSIHGQYSSYTHSGASQSAEPTGNAQTGVETLTNAYTSSNVASATKLQTARTLWGNSFDGTANVNGTIKFNNVTSGLCEGIQWTCGDSDFARIHAGATGSNAGYLEIATADDGNEPIYVRQYAGVFSSVVRTLTLLDANGFTHFPSYINIGGNENNNSSPDRVWGSNGSDSYLRSYRTSALRVAYAASAGNAETLGGFPKNYGQAPFGTIPCIENDGVMEIGRYIDFHYDNSGSYDFSTRLQANGNYRNIVSLPSASGTLALISQVLTWKSQIIDMRNYSESYWHPVTVPLPYNGYNKIKVSVQLNSGDKPSWATHSNGITCNMEIWATASGWGTTDSDTICLNYTYKFCSQNPCGWMQLGNSSLGVVFLRGGSRYTVYTDFDATFTPHNQKYTWDSDGSSQDTGGPYTSCPGLNFYMGTIRADLIATQVQARRVCAGHDPGIDNSISCSNWFRSSGNTGWYNTTYQGGWYMSDTSWIRAHNNVGIYTGGQIYSTNSIKMGNILLEHTDEINNAANGGIHLNYRNSGNVSLCYGGGNVSIGNRSPSYTLDVAGQMRASGFHHESVNSDNYILLAGGGYKPFGGDESNPIFLGYLTLHNGVDGTISDSFMCLGYSVPFTYTRGGAYCLINIPNTSFQTFYIRAAIASVHYSGAGMGDWVGNHRGDGTWWLHCDAVGSNAVQVKGFHPANGNNDSWWGGNPLYSSNGAAKIITVCLFGYVKFK